MDENPAQNSFLRLMISVLLVLLIGCAVAGAALLLLLVAFAGGFGGSSGKTLYVENDARGESDMHPEQWT